MGNLIPFAFGDQLMRVVTKDGEPWFIAADVCRILEIKNAAQAVQPLDDDEKGVCSTYTLGGQQEVSIISESGFYTLVLRSRAATTPGTTAHRFRKWVTSEVLPSLRKTGEHQRAPYSAPQLNRPQGFEPVAAFLHDYGTIEPDPAHIEKVANAVADLREVTLTMLARHTQLMTAHQRNAAIAELSRRGAVNVYCGHNKWGRPSLVVAAA